MGHQENNAAFAEQRRKLLSRGAVAIASASAVFGAACLPATVAHAASRSNPKGPAASPASTGLKPEKRAITLATTSATALPYLPVWVAHEKGFFEKRGIELSFSEQQSTARSMYAVSTGAADMTCCWLENMLSGPGRAQGLQSFVLLGASPMMSIGAAVRPAEAQAPINSLNQLRGRKLGVVALNSPTHTVAVAALRRAGIRSTELSFVSVGSQAGAQAALRSGQIDALIQMDPLMVQLEQRGEVRELLDLRSPQASRQALGMSLPSSCIAAPPEFLQRYPGTAQACSDALVEALQWLGQASLHDMLGIAPQNEAGMDVASFLASFARLRGAYSSNGLCAPDWAQDLQKATYQADPSARSESLNAQRSINNVFAERSLARLRS
jgi:NitT/TauT family transport system substrate-binding protein